MLATGIKEHIWTDVGNGPGGARTPRHCAAASRLLLKAQVPGHDSGEAWLALAQKAPALFDVTKSVAPRPAEQPPWSRPSSSSLQMQEGQGFWVAFHGVPVQQCSCRNAVLLQAAWHQQFENAIWLGEADWCRSGDCKPRVEARKQHL